MTPDQPLNHPIDNPVRGHLLRESVAWNSVAVVFVTLSLVTLGIQAACWWAGSQPHPIDALPWALLSVMLAVAVLGFRPSVLHNQKRKFLYSSVAQGSLQILWIQLVAWRAIDTVEILAIGVMFGFVVAWAFLDAIQFYDALFNRWTYLLGFSLFTPFLITSGEAMRGDAWQFFMLQILMLLVSQAIMKTLGAMIRESDQQQLAQRSLQKEHERLSAERRMLQRVSRVLSGTVVNQRFLHDISNPLQVIPMNVALLKYELPVTTEGVTDLLDGLEQAAKQSVQLLRAVRGQDTDSNPASWAIAQLIEAACAEWRTGIQSHLSTLPPAPRLSLEAAQVFATSEHVASISSLMINGSLQAPTTALDITGEQVSDAFYLLKIRDHGVPSEQQPHALKRVQSGLSLETFGQGTRGGTYRGMGIGLPLCKLQLTQHGGWVDACAPREGRGIVLEIILPTIDPTRLPESDDSPERHLSRMQK